MPPAPFRQPSASQLPLPARRPGTADAAGAAASAPIGGGMMAGPNAIASARAALKRSPAAAAPGASPPARGGNPNEPHPPAATAAAAGGAGSALGARGAAVIDTSAQARVRAIIAGMEQRNAGTSHDAVLRDIVRVGRVKAEGFTTRDAAAVLRGDSDAQPLPQGYNSGEEGGRGGQRVNSTDSGEGGEAQAGGTAGGAAGGVPGFVI
jgi:hypothetical protein